MWTIKRESVLKGAQDKHVQGISDLDAVAIGGTWHLYATTRLSPGVTVLELDPLAGTAMTDDRQSASGDGLHPEGSQVLSFGDDIYLASLGRNFAAYPLFTVNGNGDIDGWESFAPSNGPGSSLLAVDQVSIGDSDFLVAANHGSSSVQLLRVGSDLSLSQVDSGTLPYGTITAVAVAKAGPHAYALAATHDSPGLHSFRIGATGLDPVSPDPFGSDIGIGNVSGLQTVNHAGATFAIVAAQGTSSLSVFRVAADGTLAATDHVLDTRATRFQSASELALAKVDGRVFVAAAGADDGLSLLELMPDGRLVLRGSCADRVNSSLDGVSGLAMLAEGNRLMIYASSESETGITQFSVDPGPAGATHVGGAGDDDIAGGAGNNVLLGAAGNDTLTGNGGEDVLIDGAGKDRLRGGAGADLFVLTYDLESDTILDFEAGVDRLDLSGWQMLRRFEQIRLESTGTGAVLRYGDEVLTVQSADGQSLSAGDLSPHEAVALDHALNDGQALAPGSAPGPVPPPVPPPVPNHGVSEPIKGSSAGDRLLGTRGNDRIDGGAGNDTLSGGAGRDTLIGGSGRDIADYGSARGGVKVDLAHMGANTGDARGDVFRGIEGVSGSRFDDRLFGNGSGNILSGGSGRDTLSGGGGKDTLAGGAGSDAMSGGSGNDRLSGGSGVDRLRGGGDADRIAGGSGDDVLLGGGGSDRLNGGSGSDVLKGGGGNDRLVGGGAADRLSGGGGRDILNGGSGSDTMDGGKGNDVLRGGGGADVFVFSRGHDEIADFRNNVDSIDFSPHLWGGGRMTPARLVSTYAEKHGHVVEFDFGHGNVLEIDWSGPLAGLYDDIRL